MARKLPKGEETLPIAEVEGKFLTPNELRRLGLPLELRPVPTELLIERMRRRVAQGRVATIYRLQYELSPEGQLKHMELGDDIGLELIEAERKLLEEEIGILRE